MDLGPLDNHRIECKVIRKGASLRSWFESNYRTMTVPVDRTYRQSVMCVQGLTGIPDVLARP